MAITEVVDHADKVQDKAGIGSSSASFIFDLDPASAHAHIAQALDPYSDICSLGNHNKDSSRSQIRSTNHYLALCKHDHLQDLGLNNNVALFPALHKRLG